MLNKNSRFSHLNPFILSNLFAHGVMKFPDPAVGPHHPLSKSFPNGGTRFMHELTFILLCSYDDILNIKYRGRYFCLLEIIPLTNIWRTLSAYSKIKRSLNSTPRV